MRKVLLTLLLSALGMYAMGQTMMVPPHKLIPVAPGVLNGAKPFQIKSINNANALSKWYDNVDEAKNNAPFTYTNYYTDVFSDSTVQTSFTNTSGTTQLGYITTQGLGEVFDPMSPNYDSALSLFNTYNVDSVACLYRYHYVPEKDSLSSDGLVHDTLIFQFYTIKTSGIDTGVFQAPNNEPYATVKYLYQSNLGSGTYIPGKTVKYVLGQKDSSSTLAEINIPTNGATGVPLNLVTNKKNGYNRDLFAFTVSYRPGFKWKLGDTIDESFKPTPKNLHSHFKMFVSQDAGKDQLTNKANGTNNYEMSLTVQSTAYETVNGVLTHIPGGNRYGKDPGWNGFYIPGTAWNAFDEVVYSAFYLSAPNDAAINQAPVDPKGYILGNVYPNPANGTANLSFALGNTEQVKITLYDILGHEVAVLANGQYAQGTHNIAFNTDNLKEGVYLYSINAGSFAKTLKFTVAHN